MQNEGEFIDPVLIFESDEKEQNVEEIFLENGSSPVLEVIVESKSQQQLISPEDLAWVDSCLIADPELSLESWVSLKEALYDSITIFADSYEENNADESGNGEKMDVVGQLDNVNDQGDAAHVQTPAADDTEGDDRDDNDGEEEIQKEIVSPESIFRVWNLREEQEETEHELVTELMRAVADLQVVKEDEDQVLIKLKQAVAESILRDKQREATNKTTKHAEEDAELHELISTMGDLSLKPSFK